MGHRPSSLRVLVVHNIDHFPGAGAGAEGPPLTALAAGVVAAPRADVVDVENAAADVTKGLERGGHRVERYGVDGRDLVPLLVRLREDPPDVVFNLCESLAGDARHEVVLPSLFELVGVPYTGSGPLALGLALRKERAKELLSARRVPTPQAVCVADEREAAGIDLPFPLIVKPSREDASVGITTSSVVHDMESLRAAVAAVRVEFAQPALVERYIEGRELYVSLLGNHLSPSPIGAAPGALRHSSVEALPFHEIDFTDLPVGLPRIVSYAGKWDQSSAEFAGTRPMRCLIDDATRVRVERAARQAFVALGLADYARIDVRLAADGTPYVIDVNPNCDLSDGAGFSRAAGYGGYDYSALVERVCRIALERYEHEQRSSRVPVDATLVLAGPGGGDRRSAPRLGDRPDLHPAAHVGGSSGPRRAGDGRLAVHSRRSGLRARADRRRPRQSPR